METLWFILWGVLWAVYLTLDGFDLGAGTLMPYVARGDTEKRLVYNALGPYWDGNEVWLVTGGGVTFAAFPKTYAVMFSSLYTPLMLLLFALILRGISFELRSKDEAIWWRKGFDVFMVVGSFLPALLLGVFFANLFRGVPIDAKGVLQGNLLTLLNPYGLLGGVLFVLLFAVHGGLWLGIKTEGPVHDRALRAANVLWPFLLVVAVAFLVYSWFGTKLFDNYRKAPYLFALPGLAVAGLLGIKLFLRKGRLWQAWASSGAAILGAALFGVAGMYPNLLPSSLSEKYSYTAHNAASSPLTLKIMLGVALATVPVVIGYQTWVYVRFRGKVSPEHLEY